MTGLLTLAALAVVTVLLPIAGLGPIVRRGSKANNNLLRVSMPDVSLYSSPQAWKAVRAQEIAEWWMRWAVALLIALVAFLALSAAVDFPSPGLEALAALAMAWVATLWSEAVGGKLDEVGRAVEVLVDGRWGHLEAEAVRLQREWYPRKTVEECARRIERRMPLARALVWLLGRKIARA